MTWGGRRRKVERTIGEFARKENIKEKRYGLSSFSKLQKLAGFLSTTANIPITAEGRLNLLGFASRNRY
jgi:hypothetical protein